MAIKFKLRSRIISKRKFLEQQDLRFSLRLCNSFVKFASVVRNVLISKGRIRMKFLMQSEIKMILVTKNLVSRYEYPQHIRHFRTVQKPIFYAQNFNPRRSTGQINTLSARLLNCVRNHTFFAFQEFVYGLRCNLTFLTFIRDKLKRFRKMDNTH